MNPAFSPDAIASALGWTLAHSLWQITVLYLVFRLLSLVWGRSNRLHYAAALGALALAALWAAHTFSVEYAGQRALASVRAMAPGGDVAPLLATPVEGAWHPLPAVPVYHRVEVWLDAHAHWLGLAWCLGAALLMIRLLGGYWMSRRWRRRGVEAAPADWQAKCRDWAARFGIRRRVALLLSHRVAEPLTLGFWKPVILFPAALLTHLSPAQIETLLLHELAHIRRHDYLVNILQLLLEVVFFYHPLFWLISREARRRREYCCDDWVIQHTGERLLYARALTEVQSLFSHTTNPLAMTATGKYAFTERIMRIAGVHPRRANRAPWMLLFVLMLLPAIWLLKPAPAQANADRPVFTLLEPARLALQPVFPDTVPPRKGRGTVPRAESPATPADAPAPAPVVAASPTRMNVFYIGVDNPLQVAAAGVPSAEIRVSLRGNGEVQGADGEYVVRVKQPGTVYIDVYRVQNGQETLLNSNSFRVKRIPDPLLTVQGYASGKVHAETLLKAGKITPLLTNFDFDAVCEVVSFEVTYLKRESDPLTFMNNGAAWNDRLRQFLQEAQPGDGVFLDNIMVQCPGDPSPRHLGGLAYKIVGPEVDVPRRW